MIETRPAVSIIVPTLNEAPRIAASLARLRRDFPDAELIVADGGSTDGTADLARPHAHVIDCERGRGRQLRAGAAVARGEVLWFIHADTIVDPRALGQIRAALLEPAVAGGGLSLRFDRDTRALRFLAWSSNHRARRLGQIFGDQAMFVRRDVYAALGGFPDYPLMEDFAFSRRIHRAGRLAVLTATSTASARRFEAHGTWRMIAFMQVIKVLYLAGVDPARLAALYRAGPPRLRPRARTRSRTAPMPGSPGAREGVSVD
ncbi:TIGR04283 family arsenosugar biosynthesis glycosyltransferase [Actinocrinis puniceicyclus]|uniref:4,4'-diaponeurosporenoate glycosyltransferase n=1 Tax=Actinocrinis puniceicyclus TaxID=977794 RepID=A0A8J8BB15_9ACTN|nr:TIGR04283 family arsenosugar biosynthesis glycosyltransferase [Actinocrinis puniceicyclus]MBS2963547.1 TIGR04283 family arsenosugar biosynthesis glycosyltransferase [Actinocrinis puniceicyclus]